MARGGRRPGQRRSAPRPCSAQGRRMTSSSSFPPAAGARIISLGGYQPANVVTNDDLSARVDTSDEWIRSRVGIISRRYAGPDETVADMAVVAGGKALAGSGLSPADIALVILATRTPQASVPTTSAMVPSPPPLLP